MPVFGRNKRAAPVTEAAVLAALSKVLEPGSQQDLVSAGLVKDLVLDGGSVALTVVLRTPGGPLKARLEKDIGAAAAALEGVRRIQIKCELSIPEDARLVAGFHAGIRNAIAVASGKGGVGKSTVAANLAVSLARMGAAVGLMDGDLYGPNIPMMLGIIGQPVEFAGKIMPLSGHGVRVMSMGMLVAAGTPVIWRGPMLDQAIKQFLQDVMWGTLDYLLIDLPPGTGDVQLSLSQAMPLTGAIVVTTPQAVALSDVIKGVAMFQQVEVPVLGIVENMSDYVCSHCGRREELFGSGGGRQMADRFGVPLLGQVPFDARVRAGGDEGQPLVVRAPESPAGRAFIDIAQAVALKITQQNLSAPKQHRPILAPELKFIG